MGAVGHHPRRPVCLQGLGGPAQGTGGVHQVVLAQRFADILAGAGTIIWNGPVGVFEFDKFGEGTRVLSEAIAASDAFSVAGGGDTLAAIDKYGVRDRISYISTGGGAFLEFVEGKTLPAVAALEAAAVR